ncbi:MAG: zinc-ribbon domain-containing protein [Armatimonadia bacterium]|nr:zinc-ribbon domain-containing protein [Armatimonadia bacterium]
MADEHTMKCVHCGKEILRTATQCPQCGREVIDKDAWYYRLGPHIVGSLVAGVVAFFAGRFLGGLIGFPTGIWLWLIVVFVMLAGWLAPSRTRDAIGDTFGAIGDLIPWRRRF